MPYWDIGARNKVRPWDTEGPEGMGKGLAWCRIRGMAVDECRHGDCPSCCKRCHKGWLKKMAEAEGEEEL